MKSNSPEPASALVPASVRVWLQDIDHELLQTILPYWADQMCDPRGGFYGGRSLSGELLDDLPRSAVLGTRILWTFAEAKRLFPDPRWDSVVEHAWKWLQNALLDKQLGGVFWSVDHDGKVISDHKQSYAQGFTIYAAAALARAGFAPACDLAVKLYDQLEAAHDPKFGGYFEGCERDWTVRADARLSDKEPWAAKSMNTMLHVLEALTELERQAPTLERRERLIELLELFIDRIWSPERRSFGMFFDTDWRPLAETISYGHDIETAWLLRRACEVLPAWPRAAEVDAIVIVAARAVLERGVAPDGSVLAEGEPSGPTSLERHWWGQVEAMVGFWDAFEVSGDSCFAQAALRCWRFVKQHLVDPAGGDWFKVLDADCHPVPHVGKAGPWECPYHHARACYEMHLRLNRCLQEQGG